MGETKGEQMESESERERTSGAIQGLSADVSTASRLLYFAGVSWIFLILIETSKFAGRDASDASHCIRML